VNDYGTSFTETEALLAALSDGEEAADALVKEMLPGERRALARACDALSALCTERCAVCDGYMRYEARGDGTAYVASYTASGRVIHHRGCPLGEGGAL
jgi:hypothetical protein